MEFAQLTSLRQLLAGRNQLTGLPIGIFDSLRLVDLSSNNLDDTALSAWQWDVRVLVLNVSNNRMRSIPWGLLARWTQLRELYMAHNILSCDGSQQPDLGNCSLRVLDLGGNAHLTGEGTLTSVLACVQGLQLLETLVLRGVPMPNQVYSAVSDWPVASGQLQSLDLGNTSASGWYSITDWGSLVPWLKSLSLDKNPNLQWGSVNFEPIVSTVAGSQLQDINATELVCPVWIQASAASAFARSISLVTSPSFFRFERCECPNGHFWPAPAEQCWPCPLHCKCPTSTKNGSLSAVQAGRVVVLHALECVKPACECGRLVSNRQRGCLGDAFRPPLECEHAPMPVHCRVQS